eukprot:m.57012 g.57012  ORF g.57012 m.57012 type:complete len:450 (+) comp7818_c2_seq1:194-1543(+)
MLLGGFCITSQSQSLLWKRSICGLVPFTYFLSLKRSLSSLSPLHLKTRQSMPTPEELKEQIITAPNVQKLNRIFTSHGFDFRLVGGAVRDIILGRYPKDLDFSTTARPEVSKSLLEEEGIRVVLTGLQHGTVTAVLNKEQYEITTLRLDHSINGVAMETQCFTDDWELDALRRDLTINALSMDMSGKLYDYFNGREHIEQQKIVFVKDSTMRIQEDYLRILRYFRFHGSICKGDTHEESEIEAIKNNVCGLEGVSGERIWMEIAKIFTSCRGPALVQLMLECGVFPHVCLAHVCTDHVEIFRRVHDHNCNAITLLACLMDSAEQFEELSIQWHLSTSEKRQGLHIIQKRDSAISKEIAENLLVERVERETIVQLCKYKEQDALAEHAALFDIPLFPITGKILMTFGMKPGKELGAVLGSLKQLWMDSRFILTEEELLQHLPNINNNTAN